MLRSTIQLSALKILGAAAALLASAWISHWYGAAALGRYGVMSTLVSIGALIVAFGSPVFLLGNLNRESLNRALQARRVAVLLVILIISIGMVPVVIGRALTLVPGLVGFFAAWLVASAVLQAASAVWISESRFVTNALFNDALRPSVPAFALCIAWLYAGELASPDVSLIGAAGLVLFASLALVGVGVLWHPIGLWRPVLPPIARLVRSVRELLIVGLGAVPIGVSMVLITQVDRLYLIRLRPAEEVGVYVAGQTVVGLVTYFLSAIAVQKLPTLVEAMAIRDFERVREVSAVVSRYSMSVGCIALVGVIPAAPALGRLFNLHGNEIAAVAGILIAGNIISQVFGVGQTAMMYEGSKARLVLLGFLVASITISVAVGIMLCLIWGLWGAAIGSSFGVVLQRLLPYLYYRRQGVSLLFRRR